MRSLFGRPVRTSIDLLLIMIALVGSAVTVGAAVGWHSASATAITIGFFITLAYWRILRGFVGVYFGFKTRLARIKAKSNSGKPQSV